jgi:riboflavin kinase/FMN adenylyltransferase
MACLSGAWEWKMARRFHDVDTFAGELRGGVVAIGNFDGVHRGHQAVLARATAISKAAGVASIVLSFEPHPRTVFSLTSLCFA